MLRCHPASVYEEGSYLLPHLCKDLDALPTWEVYQLRAWFEGPFKNMALIDVSFDFYIRNAVGKFHRAKRMVSSLVLLDTMLSLSTFVTAEDA